MIAVILISIVLITVVLGTSPTKRQKPRLTDLESRHAVLMFNRREVNRNTNRVLINSVPIVNTAPIPRSKR